MICKKCNAKIPDDSDFCPECGQKIESAPTPVYSSPFMKAGSLDGNDSNDVTRSVDEEKVEQKPTTPEVRFSAGFNRGGNISEKEPNNESIELVSNDQMWADDFSKYPGSDKTEKHHIDMVDSYNKLNVKKDKSNVRKLTLPKLSKKVLLAATAIVTALAIVLISGLATGWFGLNGPALTILSAAEKTLTAENFTVDFTVEYDGETVRGEAYVSFDPKNRNLTLYADLRNNGESYVIAIYKDYYILSDGDDCEGEDISDELDDFFDLYEDRNDKDFSWEELLDSIYGDGTYDEAKEYIDFDKLNSNLSDYLKKLNNKKWLEENAGYSVEKESGVKLHTFEPDIHDFVKASMPTFETAFKDEDDYDELNDEIGDLKSESKNTDIEIVFGIKSGKLVQLGFDLSGTEDSLTEGYDIHIEAEFYDIGKTKIDIDELEDLLKEVR